MTKFNFSEKDKKWVKAALSRAVRTAIQVALTFITIGMCLKDIDWKTMISSVIVAFGYSILTSIFKKLPEVEESDVDGEIIFAPPEDSESNEKLIFNITSDLEDVKKKDTVVLKSIATTDDSKG